MLSSISGGDSEKMSAKTLIELPAEESKNYNITYLLLRDKAKQNGLCDVKILSDANKDIAFHKCLFGCISNYMDNLFEKIETGSSSLRVDDSEEFSKIEAFVGDIYGGLLHNDSRYGEISEGLDGIESRIDLDSKIRQLLNRDRQGVRKYCDGVISTETRDFPVHRCVASVHADYFAKVFAGAEMKGNRPAVCHVTGINDDVLAAVLDFVYVKEMWIGAEQFSDFLPAVESLGVACLQGSRLADRFLDLVTPVNQVDMWLVGKKFGKEKLVTRAEELIVSGHRCNPTAIVREMAHIDKAHIIDYVKLVKDLVTPDRLCDLILCWIDIDAKERSDMFDVLFPDVDPAQLIEDLRNTLLADEGPSMSSVATSSAALPYTKRHQPKDEDDSPVTHLVIIHGVCRDTKCVHRWETPVLAQSDSKRKSFKLPQWTQIESADDDDAVRKISGRRNFSLAYGGGILYCLGGYDGKMICSTDEVLSCDARGKWSVEPSMTEKRHSAGALYHSEKIYVAGGIGCNKKRLASMECCYRGQWTMLRPMPSCRAAFAFLPHNGSLHVIGGVSRSRRPAETHDVYSLANSSWESRASYNKHLTNIKLAAVCCGKAYVVNSVSRRGSTVSVDTFDLDTCTAVSDVSATAAAVKRSSTFVLCFPDLETCLLEVRRNGPRLSRAKALTV